MRIGIIGGSGLDDPNIFETTRDLELDTPYGPPNSTLRQGKIGGKDVVLLARHVLLGIGDRLRVATPGGGGYGAPDAATPGR